MPTPHDILLARANEVETRIEELDERIDAFRRMRVGLAGELSGLKAGIEAIANAEPAAKAPKKRKMRLGDKKRMVFEAILKLENRASVDQIVKVTRLEVKQVKEALRRSPEDVAQQDDGRWSLTNEGMTLLQKAPKSASYPGLPVPDVKEAEGEVCTPHTSASVVNLRKEAQQWNRPNADW